MFRNFTYPGSDFHEMNLDWLLCMCQRFAGLRLEVQGDYLRLVNERDEVVSSVQVSYADHALKDIDGNMIQAYILSVGTSGDTVVFTKGDNSVTAITVPYANKAKYDIDGHEIEDYVLHTQIAGDKLRITHGDGTIAELTIPYAVRATDDEEGNDITTYATTLAVDGNNVVLRDRKGRLLNSITVPYAVMASKDDADNIITSTYGHTLTTGTTTVKLISQDSLLLSEITVPYATEASHATNADFATLAEDANNAIESVAIVGDNIVFTTYDGVSTTVTCPYSVKALKDANSNEITKTYVADVSNNINTGEITFYDAEGTAIVSITPQVEKAKKDTYNNLIADYIKQILVDVNSNYVSVVHGTGTTDSLIINYSTHALDDINDQAIHNTYITLLECVEDVDDGHYKIVAYDGDTPKAELFRFEVTAYSAQTDINGKSLTSYVADVDYNASKEIEVTDGEGNVLKTLANKLNNIADVNASSPNNKELLKYSSSSQKWVPGIIGMRELGDVDMSSISDGDTLVYDQNLDQFVPVQAGSGPANPVYISPLGGITNVRDGNVAAVLYANASTAAILVNGVVQADHTWGEYLISGQYFDSTNQKMRFTWKVTLATISGNSNDISTASGLGIDYSTIYKHSLVVNNITNHNQPWVSGRVELDGYNLSIDTVGGDNVIRLELQCAIDATQSMTKAEIAQAMMDGYDNPFCTFCGKVIVGV